MEEKKYYAVKVGRHPGIYNTWAECRSQVIGFKNAVYKKFDTEDEAKEFIKNTQNLKAPEMDLSKLSTYAFVDGSYNSDEKIYGCGGFVYHKDEETNNVVAYKIQDSDNDKEMVDMRNVAGEILGVRKALELAVKKRYKEITIFYDYSGIENWATGTWKRNKLGTILYYEYIKSIKDNIKINFVKVDAHTGIAGNEIADLLAKVSVKLIKKKYAKEKIKLYLEKIKDVTFVL